jgi:hypothetical protein
VLRRVAAIFFLLVIPVLLHADSLTVSNSALTSTPFNGSASVVTDFQGNVISEIPETTLQFVNGSFGFSLSYLLPANSVITSATLTIERASSLSATVTLDNQPLPPSEDFGCSAAPCPFTPASPFVEIQPSGPSAIATVGSEQLEIPPWFFEGFEISSAGTSTFSETETFTYDLLALGWADALNTSQLLSITGSNDMLTVRSFGNRGIGTQGSLTVDATRGQLFTATLNLEFSRVPEPATWVLLITGALGPLARREYKR